MEKPKGEGIGLLPTGNGGPQAATYPCAPSRRGPPRPQRDLQPPGELQEILLSQIPLAKRPGVAAGTVAPRGSMRPHFPGPAALTAPQGPSPAPAAAAPGTALTPPPAVETAVDWLWRTPVTMIDM